MPKNNNHTEGFGGNPPAYRSLRVFSFDPSVSKELKTSLINEVTIQVPWNDLQGPGPIGEYVEVIDYDAPSQCYYRPVNLNHPNILATDGLTPSEADPQFHQQMVYAVVMATIGHFEQALGRAVLWSQRQARDKYGNWVKVDEPFVQRLRIYPHAFRGANAYYSPKKKALLFGYFTASDKAPDKVIPGSTVFTCLSHDIIVHETTHAILDGMHPRFAEKSNPDVLAIHEGFADIVALFQHFSFPEVLEHQIAFTRGDLSTESLLVDLARQFGIAVGGRGALRSAIGLAPDPSALGSTTKVHQRGAILVAAVFDAFLAVYQMRTADLLRLATQGRGVLEAGHLSPDLVRRLAKEAADTARHILHMCIRAMDYVPPVDVTFGDFLRALTTADYDVGAPEESHYRVALLESFRQRGIYPDGLTTVSTQSLLWPSPSDSSPAKDPFPRLAFSFESGSKEEQQLSNARQVRLENLGLVQGRIIAAMKKKDMRSISGAISSADTPFSNLNKELAKDDSLSSFFLESLEPANAPDEPDNQPTSAFTLEWGVEGDRRTKDFIAQQNREQFYLTWVRHWASENPEWAERELGLVLFAAEHFGDAEQSGFITKEVPRGVYFGPGVDERALPPCIPAVQIHSFRIARRRGPRGDYLTELIVEITQRRRGFFDLEDQRKIDQGIAELDPSNRGDFTMRGGCTLIVDPRQASNPRYGIRRVIRKGSILDEARIVRQRRFLTRDSSSLRAVYFDDDRDDELFAILHSHDE